MSGHPHHEPNQADSTPDPIGRSPRLRSALAVWGQVVWRHPLIFWSGVWTAVLVLASIAMSGLVNPDLSKETHWSDADTPAVIARTRGMTPRHTISPFWALGAILLSCGGGCLLLSKQFRRQSASQRVRVQSLSALPTKAQAPSVLPSITQLQPPASRPNAARSPQSSQIQPYSPQAPIPPLALPASRASLNERALPMSDRPEVNPTQASHPFKVMDRVETRAPGLAELLDIHQRKLKRRRMKNP